MGHRVIPVRMTEAQIQELETLQALGFKSRSDAIRSAVEALLESLQSKTPAAS